MKSFDHTWPIDEIYCTCSLENPLAPDILLDMVFGKLFWLSVTIYPYNVLSQCHGSVFTNFVSWCSHSIKNLLTNFVWCPRTILVAENTFLQVHKLLRMWLIGFWRTSWFQYFQPVHNFSAELTSLNSTTYEKKYLMNKQPYFTAYRSVEPDIGLISLASSVC